jgi:serine/threonine-protein kinase PknK
MVDGVGDPAERTSRAILCHLSGHFGEALRLLHGCPGPVPPAIERAVLAEIGAGEGSAQPPVETGFDVAGWHAWARAGAAMCHGNARVAHVALEEAAEAFRGAGDDRLRMVARLEAADALRCAGGAPDVHALVAGERTEPGEPPPEVAIRLRWLELTGTRGPDTDRVTALETLAAVCRDAGVPRYQWRALALASRMREDMDEQGAAHALGLGALEVLEAQALALPPRLRESFWRHPDRRRVRDTRPLPVSGPGEGGAPSVHLPGLEERTARLLQVLKGLAGEHDPDRLLMQVTDAAVELTGAERGLLLLLDGDGRLETEPRLARARGMRPDDASIPFSRSIAEAVLIDGEPIVTVDAACDGRLSAYLSVHRLELRSVACLPIRSRAGIEGVLYLEHRHRRGRFGEVETSLLRAFADQAAIALSNARLVAENEQRRIELEAKNRQLAEAKAQVEQILAARTAELHETRDELERARGEGPVGYERHDIVGRGEAMRRVFAVLDRVRDADVPVVIRGESGTGKELIARAIHYAGHRSTGPFVALNCAAVPDSLLESELFGHVRGAFTGADRHRRGVLARASGGTLLLDEVGDMPSKMQVDLLRVLQDGRVRPLGSEADEEVDVRIVAATQRPLADLVAAGRFREDLFYRLDVVELRLPPLRERGDDIPLLCDHFLKRFEQREGVRRRRLSREALARLCAHPLPGNVRQLEHVLLNACVMTDGDTIGPEDLPLEPGESPPVAVPAAPPAGSGDGDLAHGMEDFKRGEKRRILRALEAHGWNRARAARELGIPRRTFYRRLQEHGIQ